MDTKKLNIHELVLFLSILHGKIWRRKKNRFELIDWFSIDVNLFEMWIFLKQTNHSKDMLIRIVHRFVVAIPISQTKNHQMAFMFRSWISEFVIIFYSFHELNTDQLVVLSPCVLPNFRFIHKHQERERERDRHEKLCMHW